MTMVNNKLYKRTKSASRDQISTEKPFKCPNNSTAFYPSVDYSLCSERYYTCVNSVAYPQVKTYHFIICYKRELTFSFNLQKCPGSTVFDPTLNKCTSLAHASCGWNCHSLLDGVYPNSVSCHSFWQCSNGITYFFVINSLNYTKINRKL